MKLYSVHYKGDENNPRTFEVITDNFKKWLEEHNDDRLNPEDADNFEVELITPYLYNQ